MFSQTKEEKPVQKMHPEDLMELASQVKRAWKEDMEFLVQRELSLVLDDKLRGLLDKGMENAADRVIVMLIKRALEEEKK